MLKRMLVYQQMYTIGIHLGSLRIYDSFEIKKYLLNYYNNFSIISLKRTLELIQRILLFFKLSLKNIFNFIIIYLGGLLNTLFMWFLTNIRLHNFYFLWLGGSLKKIVDRILYLEDTCWGNSPDIAFLFNSLSSNFIVNSLFSYRHFILIGVGNNVLMCSMFDYFIVLNNSSCVSVYWFLSIILCVLGSMSQFSYTKLEVIKFNKHKIYGEGIIWCQSYNCFVYSGLKVHEVSLKYGFRSFYSYKYIYKNFRRLVFSKINPYRKKCQFWLPGNQSKPSFYKNRLDSFLFKLGYFSYVGNTPK